MQNTMVNFVTAISTCSVYVHPGQVICQCYQYIVEEAQWKEKLLTQPYRERPTS